MISRKVEPNIHAGVKYFRFMMDQFYKDEPMDELNKGLMTLGVAITPGLAVSGSFERETARRGLNPNKWFGNVERVVSERVGRETVQYVSNIYKLLRRLPTGYWIATRLASVREARWRTIRRRGRLIVAPSSDRSRRAPRRPP